MSDYAIEVQKGARFAFGSNWKNFLSSLNEDRVNEATLSLQRMLNVQSLEGQRFLDVGSGSGLFSLAARRLGAHVHSFDYDLQSVACTSELKRRYGANDHRWTVESGSILDRAYISSLGQFDIVYSWGVLHHTGNMWGALDNVASLVKPNGTLFIAIYNKQQFLTPYWKLVKRLYNHLPGIGKQIMGASYFAFSAVELFVADVVRGNNPALRYRGTGQRGMTLYYDVVDWIGGWPFEVASPEEIFRYFKERGFALEELVTCGGKQGCNEFVFKADSPRG